MLSARDLPRQSNHSMAHSARLLINVETENQLLAIPLRF